MSLQLSQSALNGAATPASASALPILVVMCAVVVGCSESSPTIPVFNGETDTGEDSGAATVDAANVSDGDTDADAIPEPLPCRERALQASDVESSPTGRKTVPLIDRRLILEPRTSPNGGIADLGLWLDDIDNEMLEDFQNPPIDRWALREAWDSSGCLDDSNIDVRLPHFDRGAISISGFLVTQGSPWGVQLEVETLGEVVQITADFMCCGDISTSAGQR